MAEQFISGIGASEGIGIGRAFIYKSNETPVFCSEISEAQIENELQRFKFAVERAGLELDELIQHAEKTVGMEKSVVLKGHKSFLSDPMFCPQMEKLIRTKLYSAERAVQEVSKNIAAIFENMPDEYMKERASDVKDVARRLMNALSGNRTIRLSDIKDEVILVAEDLTPSDTIQLNKKYIIAFVTEKGGKTSHTAIFSKSLGIPAVLGVGDETGKINDGDTLIIDGTEGLCIINPDEETLRNYEIKMRKELEEHERFKGYALKEAATKDGHRIEIAANIGSEADASFAFEQGAEGIGLFRTELLFMQKDKMPDEDTQFQTYSEIAKMEPNKSIIVRTLDIGGDKELDYLGIPKEMNPFLGYRAIRLCLDRRDIFKTQLRAILRASYYGNLSMMFPMISGLEEFREAVKIVEEVKKGLAEDNIPFDKDIKIGIMIEVPSTAMMASQFAKEVDFFSIGTNDLVQYMLAVDRMNEKVARMHNHFHPAVIQVIKRVIDAAHEENKWVGMCGGMAGDPAAIPLLVGFGIDELSMSATSIQKAKYMISQIDYEKCRELSAKVLTLSTVEEIEKEIKDFNT